MRTTLTLDDDVAALLRRVQKQRKAPMKEVVNAALREGLIALTKPRETRPPARMRTFDLGQCSVPNLDNITDVLAFGEGESFK